jgi:hypothetical protein
MWIYVLGESKDGRVVKIGKTDRPLVADRMKSINGEQHSDETFVLLAAMRGEPRAERILLDHFSHARLTTRGRRREYFNACSELVEYVIWLRAQHFVSADPFDTEDLFMAEDLNAWIPRPDRRLPPPPEPVDTLFSKHLQLDGPLAGTAWAWMPDPRASYNDYFTPADIVRRAWRAMDGIDLDPASHFIANKQLVENGIRIPAYFTPSHSAFDHPWQGRVWLNPPYGNYLPWFESIEREMAEGRVTQVCMISPMWAFGTVQARPHMDRAAALIVLSPTPTFYNPGDPTKTGTNQPHAIVYWGGRVAEFLGAFEDIGIACRLA